MKAYNVASYNSQTMARISSANLNSVEICKIWARKALRHYISQGLAEDDIFFEIHHNIGETGFLKGNSVSDTMIWVKIDLDFNFNFMDEIQNIVNRQKAAMLPA